MPAKKEKVARKHPTLVFTLVFVLVMGLVFYTVGAIAHKITQEKGQALAVGAAVQPAPPSNTQDASVSAPTTVQMQDFPNDQQGIFIGQLNADYFKDPIDQIVVLFVSARIPGLSIMYFPYENRLVAGTPSMNVDNIILFDGTSHEIKYAFQKDGNQQFWYDGNLVAESRFIPAKSSITGAVVGVSDVFVSEGFERVEIK